jgi:hypothetical protein
MKFRFISLRSGIACPRLRLPSALDHTRLGDLVDCMNFFHSLTLITNVRIFEVSLHPMPLSLSLSIDLFLLFVGDASKFKRLNKKSRQLTLLKHIRKLFPNHGPCPHRVLRNVDGCKTEHSALTLFVHYRRCTRRVPRTTSRQYEYSS